MNKGLGTASIKREGQAMLDMCSTQCEGVYLLKEIERLKKELDDGVGLVKEAIVEIERLRDAISDMKRNTRTVDRAFIKESTQEILDSIEEKD